MKLLESRKEEDAAAGSGQAVASGDVVTVSRKGRHIKKTVFFSEKIRKRGGGLAKIS